MERRPLGKVLVAAGGALLKSLLQSAVVLAATALAWQINPAVGSLVALVGSFVLVARSYRKQWRLLWITVLLPPLGMGLSYAVQLGMLGEQPNPGLLLAAVAVGLVLGWLRGRAHEVFVKGRQIFAQRTISYLSIWALCFCGTQAFALARQQQLIEYGMLGGAFSTAILAAVALVLLSRYHRKKQELLLAGALTVGIGFLVLPALLALATWPGTARAQSPAVDSSTALNISGTWKTLRQRRLPPSRSYPWPLVRSQGIFIVFTQQGSSVEGEFFYSDWWRSVYVTTPMPSSSHFAGRIRMRGVLRGNQLSGEYWGDPGSGDFTLKFYKKEGTLRFTGSWTPVQPQVQATWTGERIPNPLVNTLVPLIVPPSDEFLQPAVEVAIASAVIMILIALGVNTAQAIAGVAPVTVEAITKSVVQELGGTGDQRPRVKRPSIPARQPPPLIDPDDVDGKPLTVNEGQWPEVPVGHVWYGGEWVDRATARRWIAERRREIARRQAEIDRHQRLTSEMMDRERDRRIDRLQREGFVYDPQNDEWRPGEHHPETIARRRNEERDRLVEYVEQHVGDLDRADFLTGFVQRNAEDGADMARIRNVVREVTQGAHMQEAATHYNEAEEFGAWERTSEEIRDWAMRANRIAMLAATGGAPLVMAQGMTYGAIEGYAEGGFTGAATSTVVGVVDMFTAGAGSAAVRAGQAELRDGESRWGRWASEWGNNLNDQWNPARLVERGLNARTWGELVDVVLDGVDLAGDAADLADRGRQAWDHFTDSGTADFPASGGRIGDDGGPDALVDGGRRALDDGGDDGGRRPVDDGGPDVLDDGGRRPVDDGGSDVLDDGGRRPGDDGGSDVLDDGGRRPGDDGGSDVLDDGGRRPGGGGDADPGVVRDDGSDDVGPLYRDPGDDGGRRPGDDGGPPDAPRDDGGGPPDAPRDDGGGPPDAPRDDGGGPPDAPRDGDDDGGRDGDGPGDDDRRGNGDDDGSGNGDGDGPAEPDQPDDLSAEAEYERRREAYEEWERIEQHCAEQTGKEVGQVSSTLAGPTGPQDERVWQPPHPGIRPGEDQFGRVPPPPGAAEWTPDVDRDHPRVHDLISGNVQTDSYDPSTIPQRTDPPDHFYGVDEYGRPTRASGWLVSGGGTGASGTKFEGLERSHLIPRAEGGNGDFTVPTTLRANRSHMGSFEDLGRSFLSDDNLAVRVDVEARYEPDYTGRMPSEVVHHMEVVNRETGQVVDRYWAIASPDTPYRWGRGVYDPPPPGRIS